MAMGEAVVNGRGGGRGCGRGCGGGRSRDVVTVLTVTVVADIMEGEGQDATLVNNNLNIFLNLYYIHG
jgi:hypothetical protein